MTGHPFQPGVVVAVSAFSYGRGSNWRRGVVAKAYKTGRFVLEDMDQQYHPRAPSTTEFGEKEWSAVSAGGGYYSSYVYLMTPEYEAKIAAQNLAERAKSAIATLSAWSGSVKSEFFTDEIVSDLERIARILKDAKP